MSAPVVSVIFIVILVIVCSAKVNGLFEAANDLFDEMEHQYRLRQYPIVSKMVNALPTVSTIGFVVAVLINLLLLVSVRVSPSGSLDVVPSSGSGFVDVANETIASLCTAAGNVTGALLYCSAMVLCSVISRRLALPLASL